MSKIVAVIPARAGSKGIPNKNIRLIDGKPLIWYSINNAKKSKYINDIIVSSDSIEIEKIANEMGVRFRKRSESLCGDAITLDAVVYDAIKDEECDYVVTMQPTSPTLEVKTLDNAIKYAIDSQLDTVISAINMPHLSWKEENGKKVPNYKERLNRQYLPANYLETGAFVISRRSIVTEKTRIGEKVDVFEVSEKEAVDIDNYSDLQRASSILSGEKAAIFVNGNSKDNIKDAIRQANDLYCEVTIYYINVSNVKETFNNTTYHLVQVKDMKEFDSIIKEKDIKKVYYFDDKTNRGPLLAIFHTLFSFLKSISIFCIIRKLIYKKKNPPYYFSDLWVLGNLVCSLLFTLVIYLTRNSLIIIGTIISIYGAIRIFEILIYQINVVLFDPFDKNGKEKKDYKILSVQRMIIALLCNYFELAFWYTCIMMTITTKIELVSNLSYLQCLMHNIVCIMTFNIDVIQQLTNETVEILQQLVFFEVISGMIMTVLSLAKFVGALPGTKEKN